MFGNVAAATVNFIKTQGRKGDCARKGTGIKADFRQPVLQLLEIGEC